MNPFVRITDASQRLTDVSAHMRRLMRDLHELREIVALAEHHALAVRRRSAGIARVPAAGRMRLR